MAQTYQKIAHPEVFGNSSVVDGVFFNGLFAGGLLVPADLGDFDLANLACASNSAFFDASIDLNSLLLSFTVLHVGLETQSCSCNTQTNCAFGDVTLLKVFDTTCYGVSLHSNTPRRKDAHELFLTFFPDSRTYRDHLA